VHLGRRWFHLSYHFARILLERDAGLGNNGTSAILYAGARRWPGPLPASYAIRANPSGPIGPAQPGTLEHFLVERYILFTFWNGRLYQARVYHTPYPLQSANILTLDENLLAAAGIERQNTAGFGLFSPGVTVEVFPLSRA
jgi:uncharacterized protein YqjF (DUF2071 family)